MDDVVQPIEIHQALVRLRATFPEPPQARGHAPERDAWLQNWAAVLRRERVKAWELEAAVEQYLASDAEFYPKPGQIAALALQARRQRGPAAAPLPPPGPDRSALEVPPEVAALGRLAILAFYLGRPKEPPVEEPRRPEPPSDQTWDATVGKVADQLLRRRTP